MRYIKGKMHFNKSELKELEKRNPTLFELAKYVADKAHINATVFGKYYTWIQVASSNDENPLLCPSAVFQVPGTDKDVVDSACSELRCWSTHDEPSENPDKPYRPCWFRHWNEFVSDMKGV